MAARRPVRASGGQRVRAVEHLAAAGNVVMWGELGHRRPAVWVACGAVAGGRVWGGMASLLLLAKSRVVSTEYHWTPRRWTQMFSFCVISGPHRGVWWAETCL
jgi:hypothetical protein